MDIALGIERPDALRALFGCQVRGHVQDRAGVSIRGLLLGGGLRNVLGVLRKTNVFPEVHLAQEGVGLGIGDLEGAREPAVERAVHQCVADEEHEDERQERDRHGAKHHLGLESRSQLPGAALGP